MKNFNRKIKGALFFLIVCLIAFVGFSKAGILFSSDKENVVTISTTKKRLEPNNYVAAMKSFSNIENDSVIDQSEQIVIDSEEVTPVIGMVATNDILPTFEGKSIVEVGEILNKTLSGIFVGKGEDFARLSMEKGMDPFLLAAISAHETGNGTSSAARNKYNFGGIMCSGKLCSYSSFEEGLESYISVVYRNYFSKGLTTPEAMNKKYAQSTSWASKVNYWYNTLKNK